MSHTRRTLIGSNGESKVEEVGGVGEVGDHSRGQVEFSQVLRRKPIGQSRKLAQTKSRHTFLYPDLCGACLGLLLCGRLLVLLHAPYLFQDVMLAR